ncbi:MAG: cache domain-containing protein [Gemmatimonadota bacterium]|nr:MAG: cache domain-containing protein [Gemmatimonadota bacterium]
MKPPDWLRLDRELAVLLGLTSLIALAVGLVAYGRVTRDLVREAEQELALRVELEVSSLEQELETMHSEVLLWRDHGPPRDALRQTSAAWAELGPTAGERLRRLYVTENPFPEGERYKYERAPDNSAYTQFHAWAHWRSERFLNVLGYHDIFLIDPQGNVVYSYFKEEDFGTSLEDGPWRDTALGEVFRQARESSDGEVAFRDFERYEPSQGAPSAFLAGPVFESDGELLGVLGFQFLSSRLNDHLRFNADIGATGETFIVGEDFLMRSASRFADTSAVLVQRVDSESVRRALARETGVETGDDYRDIEVVAAYSFLDFGGVRWAVIAKIDLEEVLMPARALRRNLLLTALAVLVIVALGGAVAPGPLTRNQ